MSNPSMIGLLGHRILGWARNSTLSSGSATDLRLDRVQSIEPVATHNSQDYYELGNVDKIGVTTDPTTYRVTIEENLHNSKLDMFLAGVDPTSGSGFYAGNIPTQTNTIYVLTRNDADAITGEVAISNCRVSEIQYRFMMNGACTASYTLEGTSGSYYTVAPFVHTNWGSTDTTSPGGVHGKDARVAFSTNDVAGKAYRLQSFTIRVQYPVQTVRELGNRQIVGNLVDSPNITTDFELNPGDAQPHDIFFPTSNDGGVAKLVLGEPQIVNAFVNLYDPVLPEASSVLKSFKIDKLKPTTNTPLRGQVRNLTTSRWTLTNTGVNVGGTGGLTVSKTEIAS